MLTSFRSPKQFGELIRQARKKRNMSQSDLAHKIGVRQGTISMIESGNSATKLSTLLDILAAFDLEVSVTNRLTGHASDIEDIFS